jgi:hypothetical protein
MRSPPHHGAGYDGLGCTSSIRRQSRGEVNETGHHYDNAVRVPGDYDSAAHMDNTPYTIVTWMRA